jgi:hypothetical protein
MRWSLSNIGLYLLPLVALFSCGENSSTLQNVTSTVGASPASTPTACAQTVIDRGTKSNVGGTRGTYAAVAVNPLNNREATAYYDASALSIKFTYWNGSAYAHEVITGATSVGKISLVFLSTGIPVVGWTT